MAPGDQELALHYQDVEGNTIMHQALLHNSHEDTFDGGKNDEIRERQRERIVSDLVKLGAKSQLVSINHAGRTPLDGNVSEGLATYVGHLTVSKLQPLREEDPMAAGKVPVRFKFAAQRFKALHNHESMQDECQDECHNGEAAELFGEGLGETVSAQGAFGSQHWRILRARTFTV